MRRHVASQFTLGISKCRSRRPRHPILQARPTRTNRKKTWSCVRARFKTILRRTLVETLQKQGYSSSRKQALPQNGFLLEGVFAEPDKKNRIRRALLGSGSPGTKLTLYMGVFDQKSVSQPLYIEAPVQEADSTYGPVITLNAYIPMAKYEIEKDITEQNVRSICAQIAADLIALLRRNPAALARAKETLNFTTSS